MKGAGNGCVALSMPQQVLLGPASRGDPAALKGRACDGQAVPRWARATLERHAADPRPRMSLAQLEAGGTGDALWDAMQRQLVLTGAARKSAAAPAACVPSALLQGLRGQQCS